VLSSEAARRDLQKFAPDQISKARVLRFCALRPNIDSHDLLDLNATYGIEGAFFYIPNQFWAHKNHLTAIRALARIANEHPRVTIVCSGALSDYRNPDHMGNLQLELAKLGLETRFRLLGLIPYSNIAQLMLQSEAVINPSRFEGWSTTVEEAKALGVPMLLSDIDVHREQCPDGEAEFFDPLNDVALAELMAARLRSPRPQMEAADHELAAKRHTARSQAFAHEFARIVNELRGEHAA